LLFPAVINDEYINFLYQACNMLGYTQDSTLFKARGMGGHVSPHTRIRLAEPGD
jgi:hypothetical protein